MPYFSEQTQAFYAEDIHYPNMPSDCILINTEQHKIIFEKLNTGNSVTIVNGVVSATPTVQIVTWEDIKARRDGELNRSDFTQAADWPGNKQAWALYRQELRDIPQNFIDPNSVVWPTKPE